MTADELEKAPQVIKDKAVDMTGMPGYKFAMTVSTLDCTGCGSCATVLAPARRVRRLWS